MTINELFVWGAYLVIVTLLAYASPRKNSFAVTHLAFALAWCTLTVAVISHWS